MNENELINQIKKIVFSVPGEIYKFSPPADCFEGEWEEASMQEKAFLLIEELLLKSNREEFIQKEMEDAKNDIKIEIPIGPRFYSMADENMFFEALKSIPAIKNVNGSGRGILLYLKKSINSDEKDFLKSLLARYQVSVPKEIEN